MTDYKKPISCTTSEPQNFNAAMYAAFCGNATLTFGDKTFNVQILEINIDPVADLSGASGFTKLEEIKGTLTLEAKTKEQKLTLLDMCSTEQDGKAN